MTRASELPLERADASRAWRGAEAATPRVVEWRASGLDALTVAIVEPRRSSGETAVFPMSYDYRVEPFVVRRLQVIA